nr:MAG TPA: hypothetical protein [Crassvirales sp.]
MFFFNKTNKYLKYYRIGLKKGLNVSQHLNLQKTIIQTVHQTKNK